MTDHTVEDSGGPRGVPHSENDDTYDNQLVARHDGDTPVEQELEEPLSNKAAVTSIIGGARPSRTRYHPAWTQDYTIVI